MSDQPRIHSIASHCHKPGHFISPVVHLRSPVCAACLQDEQERITALEAEVAKWQEQNAKSIELADALRAEAVRLRDMLYVYGEHCLGCYTRTRPSSGELCDCGFREALTATEPPLDAAIQVYNKGVEGECDV